MPKKWFAIKKPDGTWIMALGINEMDAWLNADEVEKVARRGVKDFVASAMKSGYSCVEVNGFLEVTDA